MRKAVLVLMTIVVLLSACRARGNDSANDALRTSRTGTGIIEIRENMFATMITDININHRRYLGQTIRMEGMFLHNSWNDQDIFTVYRLGPGCCGDQDVVGLMVSWDPDYPETNRFNDAVPFPHQNDWVEVVGELRSYQIHGFPFLYLALTELNFPPVRGAEIVTR